MCRLYANIVAICQRLEHPQTWVSIGGLELIPCRYQEIIPLSLQEGCCKGVKIFVIESYIAQASKLNQKTNCAQV